MTVATDREKVADLLFSVEELEDVARTLDDDRRGRLLRVADSWLAKCQPIRPIIAAQLLNLSEPTIRHWTRQGIFKVSTGSRLEPRRFHEIWHLVYELREAGQTRNLLDAIWQRLEDRALLDRDDLAESIDQMRSGQVKRVDPDELLARAQRSQS